MGNGLALISPLTGNLNVNNNQLTNLRLEVQTATQAVSGAGRTYWQSTEGAIHVDTGTLMGRAPVLTEIQEGRLVGLLNTSGVSGATQYAQIQLATSFSLVGNLLSPPTVSVVGSYAVRGLVGANNGATPNTKYDLSADLVQLYKPSDSTLAVRTATGTLTNDTGLAGSAANGRDQAAVYAATVWLHFYFIWNGTTLATLSSLTAPPTGPALPTGYTHWAYAGAVYYNATPLLVPTNMRGSTMAYQAFQNALTTGNQVAETAVSLTALVPPNTVRAQFMGRAFVVGGSTATDTIRFRYVTGNDFIRLGQSSGTATNPDTAAFTMPVLSQSVFYISVTSGTPMTGSLDVMSYTVSNGGD